MADSIPDRSREIPRLLAQVLPAQAVQSIVELGEGTDHVAYEVNWELIVRFVADPTPAVRERRVRTEAGVLAMVKALTPPAVPEPLLVAPEDGVMVYRKIPGTPLLHLRSEHRSLDLDRFGAVIGGFLSRLHRSSVSDFEEFAPCDQVPLNGWLADARQEYERVIGSVPADRRASIETFLAGPPPEEAQVAAFCHNDLGIEHVLVDPSRLVVTGIIDWADASISDPAVDFARIYRDLGPEALTRVLARYVGVGEQVASLRQRVVFYARCSVFEDMAYGLLPGHDAYLVQSRSALNWLFP